jgi:hypothetical protein
MAALCAAMLASIAACDDGKSSHGNDAGARTQGNASEQAGMHDATPSNGADAEVIAPVGAGAGAGGSKVRSMAGATAGRAAPPSAGRSAGNVGVQTGPGPECNDMAATDQVPNELSCTGLYADIAQKQLAPGMRFFAPALQLWSDGADKQRWIYLPEGTQIDTAVADAWGFPVGTKLFKEFSWQGHRVETRMFWKAEDDLWLKASYHWNEAETSATRFPGGEVDVAGHTYYIPSPKECDQCHKGRADRALGFELISLALPGAEGLTLSELITQGLLSAAPSDGQFAIGDDGTGHAAPALSWLHINCGVSCHNDNSSAEGYSSDLRLRLPSEAIEGGSSAGFDALQTTVGVGAHTPRLRGRIRIVPGSPQDSLLYNLASTRDLANPKNQMPPIASRVLDNDGLMLIEAWIRSMSATGTAANAGGP